jgi:hypothetical protein
MPKSRHLYKSEEITCYSKFEHRANANKPITETYTPSIKEYYQYLDKNELEKSKFGSYILELEQNTISIEKCNVTYFLQYLIDGNILVNNQELFSHLKNFLTYLEENNKLHPNSKNSSLKTLNNVLYSDNRASSTQDSTSKFKKIDYSQYPNSGDFRKNHNNHILNQLHSKDGEIFLDKRGEIHLKLKGDVKFEPYTNKEAEEALGLTLGMTIKITNDFVQVDDEIIVDVVDDEKTDIKLIGEDK